MGKYLDNRLKFHTASRVGAQTGYSLAQALDPDGHIVRHTSVWTAETAQFPVNTIASTDPEKATNDLVEVFIGTVDAEGVPSAEGASIARTITDANSNVIGRVYRNSNYPAVELFYQVKMSGVASSDGGDSNGTYQAYEIKEGGKRVMDWVAPTAVIDPATGGPVAGFSGIAEASVSGTWTVLQKVAKWALSTGSWEFIPMAGILTFEPSVTPGDKGTNSTVRFTGFKYIGDTLDESIEALENKISGDIAGDYDGSLADLNAAITAEATARGEADTALDGKITAEATARGEADTALAGRATALESDVATLKGDNTVAGSVAKAVKDGVDAEAALRVAGDEALDARLDVIEGTGTGSVAKAQADAEAYTDTREAAINAVVATKVAQTEYDAAIADRYTKSAAEAMVDGKITTALASVHSFKGQVADMAALAAVENKLVGDIYNVIAAENGGSAEYYWNGTEWEEFGTVVDMSGYATKTYADDAVAAEAAIARAAEQANAGNIATNAANITTNTNAIALLNDADNVQGSVAYAVKAEADRAKAAEAANTGLIGANTSAIATLNADANTAGSVDAKVKAETDRASGVEATLRSDVDANEAAIAVLNGADTEAGSVAKAVKDAVDAEAALRVSGDETLDGKIDDEVATLEAADTALDGKITAEATARESADNTLDGKITAEQTRASGVEGGLRTDVDAANAAITILNGSEAGSVAAAVAAEETRATGVESGLRTDVDANAAAITILNGNNTTAGSVAKAVKDAVDAEAATARAAEQANATNISNEVTRATGVEAGFETRIAANEAALAALGSVDGGSIADALAGKVDTTTYATDKAALEAADTALAGRVTTNEGAITILNGDATTAGSVAKQVADAVAAEAAIARAAEQANAAAITALQGRASALENANGYEFIGVDTEKQLESKIYIVRSAKLTATLPTGDAVPQNFMVRVLVNEGASILTPCGTITPTGGDTINGQSVMNLDAVMDAVLMYDRANADWFVLTTMF